MPLSAWDKTRVYGTWYAHDGTRLAGKYTVTMPARVTVEAGEAIVPKGVYATGDLNTEVTTAPALDVSVPANDDPDVTPLGWQITVEVRLTLAGGAGQVVEKYVIDTPVNGEVNLRTIPLAQTIPPSQTMLLRGVPGGVAALDANGSISLDTSSFDGGEDDGSPESFDSTARINLESYQRASFRSYGETIRHFLRKARAKAMQAWYFPNGGYDANGDPVGTFKPVVWTGAHWEANSDGTLHKHWSVETPDPTGAIQTRFEVRFGDRAVTNAIAGLAKTQIMTNLADFVVRATNGQKLRLSAPDGHAKTIDFNLDHEGSDAYRRWSIEVDGTLADMYFGRYNDAGVLQDTTLMLKRSSGRVGIGTNDPATPLDVNGDKLRLRQSKTPSSATAFGNQGDIAWDADYVYVCVAPSTWKRAALETWAV